jgi:hypothetical protein
LGLKGLVVVFVVALIFMMYIFIRYDYYWSYDFVFMLYMLIPLQNAPPGSVLVGSITYGTVSTFNKKDDQNQHAPASYSILYIIPPSKVSKTLYVAASFIVWNQVSVIMILVTVVAQV